VLNVPSEAVPPVSVRALDDVGCLAGGGERPLGLGSQEPSRDGELQAPSGAHEQRDAELGLEMGDLFGDAGPGEVQHVRGGGEGTVRGRGEEVGELLQRHTRSP
jgi:hypothetical protein